MEGTYRTVRLHEEVATMLREIGREHSTPGKLLVGADSSVAYETMVEIMDGARLAGFDDIAFSKTGTK
jgi:biopolymer transport protein ExbD